MIDGCPFCGYDGPSPVLERAVWLNEMFVIEPLDPVADGHVIVIPSKHTPDFRDDPLGLAELMEFAADWADQHREGADGHNLIVSAGLAATQTVPHMHVHVVPRRDGDGLTIPWGKEAHLHEPKPQPGTPEYAARYLCADCGRVERDPVHLLGAGAHPTDVHPFRLQREPTDGRP